MEKEVESKFREKYALIDKNDAEQLAEAAQKAANAGLTLDENSLLLVGETDGQGFGIAAAAGGKDAAARASKADLLRMTKKNRSKAAAGKMPSNVAAKSPPLEQKSSTKSTAAEGYRKESSKETLSLNNTQQLSALQQQQPLRPS
jgi:predicted Zn-dependent protease